MKKVYNSIWVTFQKEGIHRYPAAATDPKLATGDWDDVSFLSFPHRHQFIFHVEIEVTHDDRDIEFIQFKRWLERLYAQDTLTLDHKSCEMLCDELAEQIAKKYPNRYMSISVSEDGENGAFSEYEPEVSLGEIKDDPARTPNYGTPGPNFMLGVTSYNHQVGWTYDSAVSSQSEKKVDQYLEHTYNDAMEKIDKVAAIKVEPDEKVEVEGILASIRTKLFGKRR